MSHAETKLKKKQIVEQMLLHTRNGYTMQEMAERAECSVPTIHRYLKEFEEEGVLIELERGSYRLDSSRMLSNVKLSQLEALTIYLALRRFIRQTSHAPQFMVSALEKMSNVVLPEDLQQQLYEGSESLHDRVPTPEQQRIWQHLLDAWQQKIVIHLEYAKRRTGEISEHEFEPYLFEPAVLSHGNYVIGWSRTRGELRTLKVNRIKKIWRTSEFFEAPKDLLVDDLLKHAWAVWYGKELVKVELMFAPTVADRVLETVWHPSQQTEQHNDGKLYWTVEVASTLELIPWIRGWGHEVEVLAPQNLREEIANHMRRAANLYEKI
jgi:predicted DNA-binding transcriptional regulator YafY